MKQHLTAFVIAICLSTTCYGQSFGPVDTITDNRFSSTAELTEKLLLEIKSREFDRLESLVASDWGNKGLFQKNMSEIADSLDMHGIPDKYRLTVTENTVSVEDTQISRTFLKLTYNINTTTYEKKKTFAVEFNFVRNGRELNIQGIRAIRPPSEDVQKRLDEMFKGMNSNE